MKTNLFAISLMAAGLMMSACGNSQKNDGKAAESDNTQTETAVQEANVQSVAEEEEETSVRGIEDIRKTWAGKTLTVDADKSKAGIKEFTLTFCKAYPQCGTNKALKEFLSSPNAAKDVFRIETDDPRTSGYTFGYDINCNPRNGYIRCMGEIQTDRFTYACYWNRKNGHKLFAAYMEECWESVDWEQCLVVFYDYDPATGIMTPEPALTNMIEKRAKDYIVYYIELPEQGKDIKVNCVESMEEEAYANEVYTLKWNGTTFNWED